MGPSLPGIREVETGGHLSLYNPATDEVVVLNRTASDIWRLANGEHDVDELVDRLATAYDVDRSAIVGDVETTIRVLREGGFLPVAGPSSDPLSTEDD